MKTFLIGFAVATVGLSGIANVLDVAIHLVQGQAQHLNTQLQQVSANE